MINKEENKKLRKVVRVKGIENVKAMAKEAEKRGYKAEKIANGQKVVGCVMLF